MIKRILKVLAALALLFAAFVFVMSKLPKPPDLTKQPEQSFSGFPSDKPLMTHGNLSVNSIFSSIGSPIAEIQAKAQVIPGLATEWVAKGGDKAQLEALMKDLSKYGDAGNFTEANKVADKVLALIGKSVTEIESIMEGLHVKERDKFLADAKKFNLTGIEDYVGWSVVEKEQGKTNWNLYRENAAVIKKAGLKYIPFLWIQTMPQWVINNPKYIFTSNTFTDLETEALSIYAPQTHAAYDYFFGEAKRQLGQYIDLVRIGSPYDFGETAYPASAASTFFPMKNLEAGFWVNEAPARAHFKQTMKKKYVTIEILNAAWSTNFTSFESIDYPKDNKNSRYWLDFVHWYHEGFTEMMAKITDTAKKHFGSTPININLGWPYEKINLGQDISGLARMAGDKKIYLRSPTGPSVPFIYTKHAATAAKHYKPLGFSSEPADASAPCEQAGLAYFKDLTTGVNWHFDYSGNYDRCQKSFADYRKLWNNGEYPQIDSALFFSTTSHYLDNWDSWREEGFAGGFPDGLQKYAEDLRDRIDYDVMDERLINDGFLNSYKTLIWSTGTTIESSTLEKIKTWIKNGGTLMVANIEDIKTVDGTNAFENRDAGKGKIIEINSKIQNLEGKFPSQLDDDDDVLISKFRDGIVVYNLSRKANTKIMTVGAVSTEISLEPFQIKKLNY